MAPLPDGEGLCRGLCLISGEGAKKAGRLTWRPDLVCLATGNMSSDTSSELESLALISSSLSRIRLRLIFRLRLLREDFPGVCCVCCFDAVRGVVNGLDTGRGVISCNCSCRSPSLSSGILLIFGARLINAGAASFDSDGTKKDWEVSAGVFVTGTVEVGTRPAANAGSPTIRLRRIAIGWLLGTELPMTKDPEFDKEIPLIGVCESTHGPSTGPALVCIFSVGPRISDLDSGGLAVTGAIGACERSAPSR